MFHTDETASQMSNRYRRGVQRLRPELVARIQGELAEQPDISKSELARRIGTSRQTVIQYLRTMRREVQDAEHRINEIKDRRAITHLDLVDRIGKATDEIESIIAELRAQSIAPGSAAAIFRGYGVLERMLRLLGEVIGEVSPPTQNIYVERLQALMMQPVSSDGLSAAAREAIEGSRK
jgi:transcriptional regulator with XRE-family HTH domain